MNHFPCYLLVLVASCQALAVQHDYDLRERLISSQLSTICVTIFVFQFLNERKFLAASKCIYT